MATFTMTLNEIMHTIGVDTVDDAVEHAAEFGLDKYPIWDDAYRAELNRKIIARYWNREIAHETIEMFRHRVDTVMRERMPYYIELYNTKLIDIDPMRTIDISNVIGANTTASSVGTTSSTTSDTDTMVKDTEVDGTSVGTTINESGVRSVNSITPQNQLSGNGDYADTMTDTNSKDQNTTNQNTGSESTENTSREGTGQSDGETTGSAEQTMERDAKTTGYQALPSQLIQQYRDIIVNIDLMILDELSRLFMAITSNGDEYFNTQDHNWSLYWGHGYFGW